MFRKKFHKFIVFQSLTLSMPTVRTKYKITVLFLNISTLTQQPPGTPRQLLFINNCSKLGCDRLIPLSPGNLLDSFADAKFLKSCWDALLPTHLRW